jgi:hypothetical protein
MNNDDLILGNKVISYALNTLAWGVSCAIAWSCSTVLMGIVMFIIMSIVMALLCALLRVILIFKMPVTTVEGLGRTVGGATARVTNLFTRKPVAA